MKGRLVQDNESFIKALILESVEKKIATMPPTKTMVTMMLIIRTFFLANPELIRNPDQIFVGQKLRIPL